MLYEVITGLSLLTMLTFSVSAQRYMTKNGFISFFSHTPMEDIKAENNQVAGVIDTSNGDRITSYNVCYTKLLRKSLSTRYINHS